MHAGDQFVSLDTMRFSLPPAWRGRRVWARYAAPLLRLFDGQERLIRQYVIEPGKRLYWVDEDAALQGLPSCGGRVGEWAHGVEGSDGWRRSVPSASLVRNGGNGPGGRRLGGGVGAVQCGRRQP